MEGSAECTQGCVTTACELRKLKELQREAFSTDSLAISPGDSSSSPWTSNGGSDASTDVGGDHAAEQENKSLQGMARRPRAPSSSQSFGDKADGCCVPSRLDFFDPNSELASSQYRGFATLTFICCGFYLVANPLMRWYERSEFVDPSLAVAMFYDFFYLMFMWFKLTLWSLTAFGLHLLFMKGYIGKRTLFALQHLTQAITIAYAVAHCLYNKHSRESTGNTCAVMQVAHHPRSVRASRRCMQLHEGEAKDEIMHSYTESNLEFFCKKDTPDACKHYPGNVNFRNFCYYMVVPSLVYEPDFPRGNGFRPTYFVWKLVSLVSAMASRSCASVMYLACTSYLIPTISRSPTVSLMEAISNLIFPFLFLDLLIFFIIFECICNLLAEVTNFGNRDFYHDWWNSTNWDEYSRKWNRPVHKFLLRHVYMETQQKYRWSQRSATLATFLFSALLHEMIMAVCFRFVRFYLLSLMLFQIPLVALGRYYKHNRGLANAIFWASLLLGLPLIAVAYGREFAQEHFSGDKGGWQELRVI
ncbi:hypothetical protein Esti_000247 [Eimeria stiedai]